MKSLRFARLADSFAPISAFVCSLALLTLQTPAALGQTNYAPLFTFTTLAGTANSGILDGTGSAARFTGLNGVAVDNAGNVYVADTINCTIRKVTPAGAVTTLAGYPGFAGNIDGTGSAARFNNPRGIAVAPSGKVYVADSLNHTIRAISPSGVVTTLAGLAAASGSADGNGNAARFYVPSGVAVDTAGNVFVADAGNHTIRLVTPGGDVTTIAGIAGVHGSSDGAANVAQFNGPCGLALDAFGNLFIADTTNNTIRLFSGGIVSTLAGLAGTAGSTNGMGSAALFNRPYNLALDTNGNVVVTDGFNDIVRQVTPAGLVSTLAGLAGNPGSLNGIGGGARFSRPYGIAADNHGNLFVGDPGNNQVRQIAPGALVTALAGFPFAEGSNDGFGAGASFSFIYGMGVDAAGNIYVADCDDNQIIRKITPDGVVSTLAGLAGSRGSANGTNSTARFYEPSCVAADSSNNVFVADAGNNAIRKITPAGVVTTFAGGGGGYANGTGSQARFNFPSGIAADSANNLYVADQSNHAIRKITPGAVVTTLAGGSGGGSSDGTGSAAHFYQPNAVAVDSVGNVYVADTGNYSVRMVTPAGVVTTLAGLPGVAGFADGIGSSARFTQFFGIAVDGGGNVFVADSYGHTIRTVTPAGVVTTIAGLAGNYGGADGTGNAARFHFPNALVFDSAGNLYVADTDNFTIRKGVLTSSIPAPRISSPSLTAGLFSFYITGSTGLEANVESSPDLIAWRVIGTAILVGGTNHFIDPNPPQGIEFYRAHLR